jgi:hypothetical protein
MFTVRSDEIAAMRSSRPQGELAIWPELATDKCDVATSEASAGSSPAGGAKEKQIANRRSAFLSFVLLGLNRIAIMIRNVFRFCLQNARVERARKTCDLAERQRG